MTTSPTAPSTSPRSYGHFGIVDDAAAFGLDVSSVPTAAGVVTVRHGRRSDRPNAPAIILLHGAAGSWSTFTPLLAAARVLGLALDDLVIPDLPGWGDSPLPESAADQTIEAIAASVAEVARFLGYDEWMIVGHSLGGFVALELGAAEPEATMRVLLVSPTTFGVSAAVRQPLRGLRTLPAYVGMLGVMRTLAHLGGLGTRFVASIAGTRFFRLSMSPLFAEPRRIHPSVYRALAAEARPRAFAIASARAGDYDGARWASIRCPVRSLSGSADVFVAAADAAQLAATIPDFAAAVLPGTGHFGHVERPLEVLQRLFAADAA